MVLSQGTKKLREKKVKKKSQFSNYSSTRIFIGLLVGIVIGYFFELWALHFSSSLFIRDWIILNVFEPLKDIFLRSLIMLVVPLVFCSLIMGVCKLGSLVHLGRLGTRIFSFYVFTSFVAIFVGQVMFALIQPGKGISKENIKIAQSKFKDKVSDYEVKSRAVPESLWPGIVKTIVPKNLIEQMAETNMLAVIFAGLLLGIALLGMKKEDRREAEALFNTFSNAFIKIVGWVMLIAPYAVAALVAIAITDFGLEIMRKNVTQYVLVVFLGYFFQFFVVYSLINKLILRIPLREFYKRLAPIFATAFGTSSSSATMPVTINTLEKNFGVPDSITKFSIPLGMTVNMDGTALFEVVAALFIAQVSGIDLSFSQQIALVIIILLTSIGVAGVPSGSIPIVMSAMAFFGIPPEGIALVLGIDRLLDMGRTVVNVTGDATGALYLARVEKATLLVDPKKRNKV